MYAIGRSFELEGTSLEEKMALPIRDFAVHGGGFPIRVSGAGYVGAVTVSGAPQREDHAIVVAVLAEMCGVPHADVALDCRPGKLSRSRCESRKLAEAQRIRALA